MNIDWYINRLKKMEPAEVCKRLIEHAMIAYSSVKYRDASCWPYSRFAPANIELRCHSLPEIPACIDIYHYRVYNLEFDLSRPLDWYFSEHAGKHWPEKHYAGIDYRPGNPYGDVRINWELSRLQFLPFLASTDGELAKSILADWLMKNRYQQGPGYLSSMEVALRWFSIYRTICILRGDLDSSLRKEATGLAVASAEFIAKRLSTHSSAGNHLIVEATGLFWIGKALEEWEKGKRWISMGRTILHRQIERQINADGSSREQSFWYLGFVLDAVRHYLLLEDPSNLPPATRKKIENAFAFIRDMTLADGTFPDFGDRDDGFIFRSSGTYGASPFPALIDFAEHYFKQHDRQGESSLTSGGTQPGISAGRIVVVPGDVQQSHGEERPLKVYSDGGMTLMQQGKGRLLFRHAPLGLPATYGHGHADALSVIFYWDDIPVLVDLGSGQYNGDQRVRDYFRSTIAHNTVEVGGRSQARAIGPFLWEKSYSVQLKQAAEPAPLSVEAVHDGYLRDLGITHTRKITWPEKKRLEITDSFTAGKGIPVTGAFHFGACRNVTSMDGLIKAQFENFDFLIEIPSEFSLGLYFGSKEPFSGWRSTVYGKWEPIHALQFSRILPENHSYTIRCKIECRS